MNFEVSAFVVLSLLAQSYALPIGSGFSGISLAPSALGDFWNQEVVIGTFPVNYGFSWSKDGSFEAGIRVETKFNGRVVPISIAVAGNVRDVKKTFQFEVGTRILDSLGGLIYGNRDGLKWLSSLWLPVQNQGGSVNAVGVSLEGDNSKPVAISGGIGINNKVYQTRIKLDENLRPFGTQVLIGVSPMKTSSVMFPNRYY